MKVLDEINKKFGDGSAFYLGQNSDKHFPAIPTGSLRLDIAIGIGGIPRGRITEIYGLDSSGKTTLSQHIIAEAQKIGGLAAFVDVEHALDPYWAELSGIDLESLIISQPDSGEQALEIVEMYIRSGEIDLVVLDSVAALAPKAEIEGEMGDSHMALIARLMSQAMRKLTASIAKTKTAVVFTNQVRDNIGAGMFGPQIVTPGGKALKFYASLRLETKKSTQIKQGDEVIGNLTKVWIRKNKVAPPFKSAEFDILYDEGISRTSELRELGILLGLIKKGGAGWYTVLDQKVQGDNNLRQFFKENWEFANHLENQIRDHYGLPWIFLDE